MALLYCTTSMQLGQGHVVIRDYCSALSCPHRKLNLKQSTRTLANDSKVQRKQEAVGNLPFVQFPITSYVTLAPVSPHCSEDQCCHAVIHTLLVPNCQKHGRCPCSCTGWALAPYETSPCAVAARWVPTVLQGRIGRAYHNVSEKTL